MSSILIWSNSFCNWIKMPLKLWLTLPNCTSTTPSKVNPRALGTTTSSRNKISSSLPPLIPAPSTKSMLKWPTPNCPGRIKEASLWKLAASKPGSVIYRPPNLLRCGPKDTLNKPSASPTTRPPRKFWSDLMMVWLTSSEWQKQAMRI